MTMPEIKDRQAQTHRVWLIAGGLLYLTAASLEWLIANTHGVPITSVHEHTIVPGVVHTLATVSIPVSLFPILRRRSVVQLWLLAAGIIALLLLTGLTLAAGLLAWVLSAATLVWHLPRSIRKRAT